MPRGCHKKEKKEAFNWVVFRELWTSFFHTVFFLFSPFLPPTVLHWIVRALGVTLMFTLYVEMESGSKWLKKKGKKRWKPLFCWTFLTSEDPSVGRCMFFSLWLWNGRSILYSYPGSIFKFLIQLCGKTMSLLQTPTLPPSLNVVSLRLAGVSFRDAKALQVKG